MALRVTLDCGDLTLEFDDGEPGTTKAIACPDCSNRLRKQISADEADDGSVERIAATISSSRYSH